MQDRLRELLVEAADAWCDQTSHNVMLGSWRGDADLQQFAKRFRTREEQLAANEVPGCLVIAEFARWAISDAGTDADVEVLLDQGARIVAVNRNTVSDRLEHAITRTVPAAVAWRRSDREEVVDHVRRSARVFDVDRRMSFSTLSSCKSLVSPEHANIDLTSSDQAYTILQLAHDCGAFGTSGVTTATWLTLYRLTGHVFGNAEALQPDNKLKVLTAGGGAGYVMGMQVSKHSAPQSYVYLDPLSFGVTSVDTRMRHSLYLAWRVCQQSAPVAQQAFCISADIPALVQHLHGGSAGGLLAAALVSTAMGQKLDSTKSATCTLSWKFGKALSNQEIKQRKRDEQNSIHPQELILGRVGQVIPKIEEAWRIEHGIDEVFLHAADAEAWHAANPGRTAPKVTGVHSFPELMERLSGHHWFDRELERHSNWQHGAWERATEAVREDEEAGPQRNEDYRNRDHRFDCYVDPTFKVEGPMGRPEQLLAEDLDEAMETTRIRDTTDTREEVFVPGGDDDEQLLNLLELSFQSKTEVWQEADANPQWLSAGKQVVVYDNAGAGKTVCSHRILHVLTDKNCWKRLFGTPSAPLVIRLDGRWCREFPTDRKLLNLRDLLTKVFVADMRMEKPDDNARVESVIDHALRERRVVLIVDGFDQFPVEDRDKLVAEFTRHPAASKCHWIITSRVHTIDSLRDENKLFGDGEWMRVRMEQFSEDQQNQYFHKVDSNGRSIGDAWTKMVDRESMSELLGLPMVLAMIRVLYDDAQRLGEEPPRFESLSDLYLVTSRKLLVRALEKNETEVTERLAKNQIPSPLALTPPKKLGILEHVLTLMAFQLMLIEEYNGRRDGEDQDAAFEELCKERYFRELEDAVENESRPRRKRELEKQLDSAIDERTRAVEGGRGRSRAVEGGRGRSRAVEGGRSPQNN